jgi:hypothetical protein
VEQINKATNINGDDNNHKQKINSENNKNKRLGEIAAIHSTNQVE